MADSDNELNCILRRRAAPPPPAPGWERRIADAAFAAGMNARRVKNGGWKPWLDELRDLFILPRPAYALAVCLLIGIAAGLAAEPVMAMMQQDQGIFLDMEDDAI